MFTIVYKNISPPERSYLTNKILQSDDQNIIDLFIPMKVTFDKNVYEYIADPEKQGLLTEEARSCYRSLKDLIMQGLIVPFISETILTYETLKKDKRQEILSHGQPINITTDGHTISMEPNPDIHPGNTSFDDYYLPRAIALGFRILPDCRFGKLINPSVKSEWYYLGANDFFLMADRFTEVDDLLSALGVGYSVYKKLADSSGHPNRPPSVNIANYKGSTKTLSAALSERSDGDSVALHIANNIDFFCTRDSGKNAGHSVFAPAACEKLKKQFGFRKGTPEELLSLFSVNRGLLNNTAPSDYANAQTKI